jgi:N-acetylglucosamine kinase-like BadF-type ATPase
MIIIADSESTKCAWAQCSTNGEIIKIHQTVGFNPKYTSHNSLLTELENSSLSAIRNQVKEIHFYGAGCSSNEKNNVLQLPMQEFFLNAKINIMHDLEAAIKATYKGVPIISCILGTGSNSCVYDGENIIENSPSLGYILGDEASGNYFGKQLINLYVNKKLPVYLVSKLEKWTKDKPIDMIEKIYSLEKPNLYLAAFFKFMFENKQEEIFDNIFREGIKHFFNLRVIIIVNVSNIKLLGKNNMLIFNLLVGFLNGYSSKLRSKKKKQFVFYLLFCCSIYLFFYFK